MDYLIPANSKKSQLILGFFTPFDLIIFGLGSSISILLLLIINTSKLSILIIVLLPLLISTTLVMPVVYYHNVMQFLINIVAYLISNKKYYWKGWCINEKTK